MASIGLIRMLVTAAYNVIIAVLNRSNKATNEKKAKKKKQKKNSSALRSKCKQIERLPRIGIVWCHPVSFHSFVICHGPSCSFASFCIRPSPHCAAYIGCPLERNNNGKLINNNNNNKSSQPQQYWVLSQHQQITSDSWCGLLHVCYNQFHRTAKISLDHAKKLKSIYDKLPQHTQKLIFACDKRQSDKFLHDNYCRLATTYPPAAQQLSTG